MMKILNLARPETSDIKFGVSRFPDGQQDVVIDTHYVSPIDTVEIKSRFVSFKDLELIVCATQALRRIGVKKIHLNIPYLLGARSDRQFKEGGTSYLVDVIAPVLNAQGYESVNSIDVHSDVAAACIKNFFSSNNLGVVAFALKYIDSRTIGVNDLLKEIAFVSPDAGSLKKIYKVVDNLQSKEEVIVCSKHRDEEGKLSRVNVPIPEGCTKDFIIIDDICDGGRTFIEIAKVIRENKPNAKIYLIVTHGIFSAGFEELYKYFTAVFTTNSVRDLTGSFGYPVEGKHLTYCSIEVDTFVNQLNVF